MKTFLSFSRSITWRGGEVGTKRNKGYGKKDLRNQVMFQLYFNILAKRYFPEIFKV